MSTVPDPVITAVESLPPLRQVIHHAGLDARKSLGQNFLLDLNLTGGSPVPQHHLTVLSLRLAPAPAA